MSFSIEMILFGFLLVMAVVIGKQRNLFAASMLMGIFSLIAAGLFSLMDAQDVAFTEASVGAGMSTVLFLATLALMPNEEKERKFSWSALAVVTVTGAALIYGTIDMPLYGDPLAPVHQHIATHFLEDSWTEIGLPNIVTSVLASYRGFDTFGELAVVFTAGVGVTLILGIPGGYTDEVSPTGNPVHINEMPVVRAVSKALLPFILLFALYVQAHGDFGPGGGFQAGVILATGYILYALVWGSTELERVIPRGVVERITSVGVLFYGGVGVFSMISGFSFLDYSAIDPEHPAHGQHLGIFLVELGVGITVSAVMIVIYYVFTARGVRGLLEPER